MAKKVIEKKVEKADLPAGRQEKKSVLISPRITEKTAIQGEKRNVYAFNVEKEATKSTIKASIKAQYKVTPIKIHMVTVPSKNKFARGKWGVKSGGKKAYVYLKKGDKIDVA